MKKYLRRNDRLGYRPQMTYKKDDQYGTSIGGCMTCCATLCILTYVALIFLASFILGRDYKSESQTLYQSLNHPSVYQMNAHQFIPAVQILRLSKKSPFIRLNESDLYDMHYLRYAFDENGKS